MTAVRVYRRAGCGFCRALLGRLRRAGVAIDEIDIWADPEAAAFVRRHANGNETVPTVDIAGTVLVNPSASRVLDLASAAGIPIDPPPPPTGWFARLRDRFGGYAGQQGT